jgi:hypothetical protein
MILAKRLMTGTATLAALLFMASGCRHQQARTDQQIAADVQSKLQVESALAGQNIQVSVVNGVATLDGTVSDQASRALAANDSSSIEGVRTVVNNLSVQPTQKTATVATPEPRPSEPRPSAPPAKKTETSMRYPDRDRHDQDPVPPASQPVQNADMVEAKAPTPVPAPAPPPAPPKPTVKDVTLPGGTVVPVRITETLDSQTASPNDAFHGVLASDLGIQGVIAIPHGTSVMGRVVDTREAAHFQGSALLSIELTELQLHGQTIAMVTDSFRKEGAGRGKDTAVKVGGGAALGAIIGGIAGGGQGAAIGSVAGGAAGTGVNAATRGKQVVIPTETLINFQLQSPITVRVTLPPPGVDEQHQEPQLHQR